ncbi:MAG: DUF5916 domain-containing protein [Vicinamibacterales bacterium]
MKQSAICLLVLGVLLSAGAAQAQSSVRAVRLTAPLKVDGKLDEPVYAGVTAISDFLQQEPREGSPATERTDVWLFFDRDNFYVVARCWESEPERAIANELRRDNLGVLQNDNFAFLLDTFHDRRNGVLFQTTPLGTRVEGQTTNEREYNGDWNPIWDLAVGTFEGGWTVEAAVPFKSLRYRPGAEQTWGILLRRISKWKNEISYNVPVPASRGLNAITGASLAADLVGIEAPGGSRNFELKPFATSNLTTDRNASPAVSNNLGGAVGLDARYGVTQNVTANLTLNTDFAQVEADEQQINLTRFNLFFPEKREFFLENQGVFSFGGAGLGGGGDTPVFFYSRAIGLSQGRAVPIDAGGRVTGRMGPFTVGALNIESGDDDVSGARATNFSVVRVKRDVLARSSVGAMYTGRSLGASGTGRSDTYGFDGTFNLLTNLSVNSFWATHRAETSAGDDTSYRGQVDYGGDRYGFQFDRLVVGNGFAPGVGFVRRRDIRKTFGQVRFSPRTPGIKAIRKLQWIAGASYIENFAGRLETRATSGEFDILFQSSDSFAVSHERNYEFVPRPFDISPGVTIAVAGYRFANTRVAYVFGRQRPISGTVALDNGTFYDGDKTTLSISQSRVNPTARFAVEPTYSVNRVRLVAGSFTTHLMGSRVTYTMTPLMFTTALLQFNSSSNTVSANLRLRWEYRPGSELFVVYNEERDTASPEFPSLSNRSFIVKINRLLRF